MTEKITFMGVEIGTVCETCGGTGSVENHPPYPHERSMCQKCEGNGFIGNSAFDALMEFSFDFTAIQKFGQGPQIKEFIKRVEQAVGYTPLEVHLASIHAPRQRPDETQAEYDQRCRDHLEFMAKALTEHLKNPSRRLVHVVGGCIDGLADIRNAVVTAIDKVSEGYPDWASPLKGAQMETLQAVLDFLDGKRNSILGQDEEDES